MTWLGPGLTVPEALATRLTGYRPVDPFQGQESRTWRLDHPEQPSLYLKRQEDPREWQSLALERFVLQRLGRSGLPVPKAVEYLRIEEIEYLVITTVPGKNLVECFDEGLAPQALVEVVASAISRIHAARPRWPDGINTPRSRLEIARTRVRSGLVDPKQFEPAFAGWSPERVLAEVERRWRDELPQTVFVHGDLYIDNLLADGGALSGIVDWSRAGLGDPYMDLAVAVRSLEHTLGPGDWDRRLAEACGFGELDRERMELWLLLDELF
jgi:aminoglycoside phosphotransferase